MGGTKSSPMPSTVQLPASSILPVLINGASTEPTGSASTISVFGETFAKKRPMPVSVPPEPTPTTTASTSSPSCFQISGPVVVSCASRVGGVGELVDVEGAGDFGGDFFGHVLVVFGMALADVRAGHADLGAERPQMLDLLARHLVGDDQHDVVALGDADLRQAKPGIAGGRLDDGAAGRQPPVALGIGDHRQRDAILDRAAGVLAFQLDEQPAAAGVELGELDDRRFADQVQHARNRADAGGSPAPARSFSTGRSSQILLGRLGLESVWRHCSRCGRRCHCYRRRRSLSPAQQCRIASRPITIGRHLRCEAGMDTAIAC